MFHLRRPRSARRASVLLAVHAFSLGGCYGYSTPPPGTTPSSGTDVRITLTDAGSVQLASLLGPRVQSAEGQLVQTGSDSVVLRVSGTTAYDGRESTWGGDRVAMPAGAVASIRTRQLDRKRTVLATIAGVAVLVGSILAFRGKSDDGTAGVVGTGPPTTQ